MTANSSASESFELQFLERLQQQQQQQEEEQSAPAATKASCQQQSNIIGRICKCALRSSASESCRSICIFVSITVSSLGKQESAHQMIGILGIEVFNHHYLIGQAWASIRIREIF